MELKTHGIRGKGSGRCYLSLGVRGVLLDGFVRFCCIERGGVPV